MFVNPGVEFTGGGVMTTSGDLVRWAQALYTGRAMATPYLQEMLTPQTGVGEHDGGAYGLGVTLRDFKPYGAAWGHSGTMPYYSSVMAHVPARGIAVAMMANRTRFDRPAALKRLLKVATY